MSNLHVCRPAQGHLFVLDLLVSLSVVRVQLDALAQLALDHFSILQKKNYFSPQDFSDSNLVPDGEASTLCDEPLAAADHLVGDLHQEGGHPLRRVVEA